MYGTPPPPPHHHHPNPGGMRWFPAMFCHARPSSLVFFFFFSAGCSILSDSDLQIKKNWSYINYGEPSLWLSQYYWLVLHANFISCRVIFVLRCFYKSTPVVCAVARNGKPYCLDELWPALIVRIHWDLTINAVHAFQNTKKNNLVSHPRL